MTRLAKAPSTFTPGRHSGHFAVLALAMACALLLLNATGASAATKYYDSTIGTTSGTTAAVPPTPSGTAFGGSFGFSSSSESIGDVTVNEPTITTDGTGQSGWIYVVDRGNNRIQAFDANKNFKWAIGRDVIATSVSEAQVLTVKATGGKFKLELDSVTTATELDWNISPFNLDAAIGTLVGGASNVVVTGTPATVSNPIGRYAIQFSGTKANLPQNQITVQPAATPLTGTASVETIADGIAAVPGNLGDVFEKCTVAAHCKAGSVGTAADGPGGEFNSPQGIAINQATGDFFVREGTISIPGGGNRRVQEFTADGQFIRAFGWNVVASGPGNDLDTDGGGPDLADQFETCNAAASDVCQAATTAGSANGQFGNPAITPNQFISGVAVAPPDAPNAGKVYVADPGNTRIIPFTVPAGPTASVSPGTSFGGSTQFSNVQQALPRRLAADSLGVVYAPGPNSDLVRYDTTAGTFLPSIVSAGKDNQFGDAGAEPRDVEIDPATGHVLVLRHPMGITELDLSSKPESLDASHIIDRHGLLGSESPQALGAGGGRFFITTNVPAAGSGIGQRVLVFDETGVDPPPTVELLTPTDVECTTATLRANVNPNGPTGFTTSYRFQVSLDGVKWTDVSADQVIGDGNVPVFVDDAATGLGANSEYRLRVRSQRSPNAGTIFSSELIFTTDPCPPQAETLLPFQVSDVSAQLNGRLQSGGIDTDYWFEWGTDTGYGKEIPTPSASSDDPFPRLVSESLGGLAPQTTYHYRLCAQNALSPSKVCGLDESFATRSAAFTPEGRAYEMVTSPDKVLRRGGSHGTFGTELTRFGRGAPSADGDSFMWGMYAGISDPAAGASWSGDYAYELRNREDRNGDGKADGWYGQSLHNAAPHTAAASAVNDLRIFSTDLRSSGWDYQVPLFASGSKGTVHVVGDDGGPLGKGMYPLFDDAWVSDLFFFNASGQISMSDDGERMLLEGAATSGDEALHRLQAVGDPLAPDELSPPQTSGHTPFLADASSDWAPRDMIGECTGPGGGSTLLPTRNDKGTPAGPEGSFQIFGSYTAGDPTVALEFNLGPSLPLVGHTITSGPGMVGSKVTSVGSETFTVSPAPSVSAGPFEVIEGGQDPSKFADDEIAGRACGEGSPTSTSGATLNSGGRLDSSFVTTMSDDGHRVFFLSPDPAASGVPSACTAGDSAAGAGTSCPPQLFVRQYDDDGDATVRWISKAQDALFNAPQKIGLFGNGVAFEGASRDGSVAYFRTNAPLTVDDPNGAGVAPPPGGVIAGTASGSSWDLYRYELPGDNDVDPAGGTLTRVSGGPGGSADPNTTCTPEGAQCGGAANGGGNVVRFMSDDGERVYFVTAAQIPGAANAAPAGGTSTPTAANAQVNRTERNLYLYDAGKSGAAAYEFIARIPFAFGGNVSEKCLSSDPSGSGRPHGANTLDGSMRAGGERGCVQGTRSGDAIAFETPAQLTVDDDDDAIDVYVYDADVDELTRVSAPPAGTTPYVCVTESGKVEQVVDVCNADLGFDTGGFEVANLGSAGNRNVNMAEGQDGELTAVFFETQVPFLAADQNDRMDVYEWQAGNSRLSLLSPGHPEHGAYFTGNSPSGRDVFFWTEQRISPWELDPLDGDVYDARRGGGLPDPPVPPPVCAVLAGTCQGAPPAAPPASGASSASLSGQGNFTEKGKGRCAKGKVRRSGKCVKKQQKKKQKKSSKRDKRSQGRAGR